MNDPNEIIAVEDDARFAIIPEWVLDAKISDRAVRLYGVLKRYANKASHEAWPKRATLAKRLNASVASIDRALTELTGIGAVTIRPNQRSNGWRTANVYVVHNSPQSRSVTPEPPSPPVTEPRLLTGEDLSYLTGDDTGTRATEREPVVGTSRSEATETYEADHEPPPDPPVLVPPRNPWEPVPGYDQTRAAYETRIHTLAAQHVEQAARQFPNRDAAGIATWVIYLAEQKYPPRPDEQAVFREQQQAESRANQFDRWWDLFRAAVRPGQDARQEALREWVAAVVVPAVETARAGVPA